MQIERLWEHQSTHAGRGGVPLVSELHTAAVVAVVPSRPRLQVSMPLD